MWSGATFPALVGNLTFTPTNGFGTYISGVFTNLTCNNPWGQFFPGNPILGTNSTPCRVGMTIHNLANPNANNPTSRQQPPINWDQILGTASRTRNNSQCNNVGTIFNPFNSFTNPLGFLGNMEVFNGTGRFVTGPFNFTLNDAISNPLAASLSVLNLPVVVWGQAVINTIALANQWNPARVLSCSFIRLTQM